MPKSKSLSPSWKKVKATLQNQFRFSELRPGQEDVIRSVLRGENALAIMPTGAGKSLCYQLPALHLAGVTIVVSPLISLMKDQREKVEEKGITAGELNSGVTRSSVDDVLEGMESETTEIVYVTPERFSQPEFISSMESATIDFVVIDEAHCVSQWGHDFRPAYLTIGDTLKKLKNPPVLALTATATEDVAVDIQKQLGLKSMTVYRTGVFRKNLLMEARYLDKPQEKFTALLEIVRQMPDQTGIVYTATVRAAKDVQAFLIDSGIDALIYHGKLSKKERDDNQNDFMNNSPRIIVATNAFGMGIDKPDVRFVIHFQFPASLEAYYQEAGRAGRDHNPARCILLYLRRDKSTQSLFLSGKYPSTDDVVAVYRALVKKQKNGLSLSKDALIEDFKGTLAKTKISVIFSLLKQSKILGETKKLGLHLKKDSLKEVDLIKIAATYTARAEKDQQKLNQVIRYAQTALCRWRMIMHYFDEEIEEGLCGHCDNCLKPDRHDLTMMAVEASAV